jgi:hypothetical protein
MSATGQLDPHQPNGHWWHGPVIVALVIAMAVNASSRPSAGVFACSPYVSYALPLRMAYFSAAASLSRASSDHPKNLTLRSEVRAIAATGLHASSAGSRRHRNKPVGRRRISGFGFRSRASRCASLICAGLIKLAA